MYAMSLKSEITRSEQEARAKLREIFLRGVNELCGAFSITHEYTRTLPVETCRMEFSCFVQREPCKILTYERTELKATFSGWQPDGTEILVRDLKTPANSVIPTALLRTPDILAIQFERPVQLP